MERQQLFNNCTNCTNCTDKGSDLFSDGFIVSFSVIMVLIILLSILGNSVVCVIVYRKAAMRSAINLLLANMALTNILLASFCMTFALATLIQEKWTSGIIACQIIAFLHHFFICEATMILFAISIDRYLIIVCRKDILNPFRAKTLILGSWCFSAVASIPPVIGWSAYGITHGHVQCILKKSYHPSDVAYLCIYSAIVYFLPFIIMIYTFICILNTVRKNSLRVQSLPGNDSVPDKLGLAGMVSNPLRVNFDMSFKTRAFKTILILFIVYVICWAPYAIYLMIWNFVDSNHAFDILFLWLAYMNCAINPVIYCWRIKKFREACRQILPKAFKLIPQLPEKTRRRINPSSVYQITSENVTNQTAI